MTTKDGAGRLLAERIGKKFEEAQSARRLQEEGWLADLRQFKGQYDDETLRSIGGSRCKLFIRQTRIKVQTVNAKIVDVLFPNSGGRNWRIDPTPNPDLGAEETSRLIVGFLQANQRPPTPEELKAQVDEMAADRAKGMAREIDDCLDEGGYTQEAKKVIHSGTLYGTGILKGPMAEQRDAPRWLPTVDVAGQPSWELSTRPVFRPWFQAVPIWDLYPDPDATDLAECQFLIQRHVMTKGEVLALADRNDFSGAAIRTALAEAPTGNLTTGDQPYETTLRGLGRMTGGAGKDQKNRYQVLEFWGWLDHDDLPDGSQGSEDPVLARPIMVNVWVLGTTVIKVVPTPLDEGQYPYHFYHHEKDESSFWGEGLASIYRDPQRGLNAVLRAMIDNAAIAAGPQMEIDVDLLVPNQDPTEVTPFKVWRRRSGVDPVQPLIRVYTLPSHTREFMEMAQFFKEHGDSASVPSYMSGEHDTGSGNTAAGLSMLMGAANTALKNHIRAFDDQVTRPFIAMLYRWLMRFHPAPGIKGDYQVVAVGSSTMIAKEVQARQLTDFAMSTNNPVDAPLINRAELHRRRAAALDLGDGIVKTEEELGREQAQAVAAQQSGQQLAEQAQQLEEQARAQSMALRERQSLATQAKETAQARHLQAITTAKNMENLQHVDALQSMVGPMPGAPPFAGGHGLPGIAEGTTGP